MYQRQPILIVSGILLIAFLMVSYTALAGQNKTKNQELIITEVHINFDNDTITINGMNFDNGNDPVVLLGNDATPLSLIGSPTANEIVAVLPD